MKKAQFLIDSLFSRRILEANVVNAEDLERDIAKILDAKGVEKDSYIRKWFDKVYMRWFSSAKDDNEKPIVNHTWKEGDPEWAKDKPGLTRYTQLTNDQRNAIAHTVDYFNTLNDIELPKIMKQPYAVVKTEVEKWDRRMAKAAEPTARKQSKLKKDTDYKIVLDVGDYVWVKLLTKCAYGEEGEMMGHCVGGYNPRTSNIYSLRSKKTGVPHVTVEVKNNAIQQIKGTANSIPKKYSDQVKALVDHFSIDVTGDGEALGMLRWKDQYIFPDSDAYREQVVPVQKRAIADVFSRIEKA